MKNTNINKNIMKRTTNALLTPILSIAFASAASAAVTFSTVGAASYSYSGSGGTPGPGSTPLGTLPAAADLATITPNITIVQYTLFGTGANVWGLGSNDTSTATITWHFQTASGLAFLNNATLSVGTGVDGTKPLGASAIIGEYSFDNATWTNFGSNTGSVDLSFNAVIPANGQDDIFVRFQITANQVGQSVLTWGGGAGERGISFAGNVAAIPEPSAALLGGVGILALLRRRRNLV